MPIAGRRGGCTGLAALQITVGAVMVLQLLPTVLRAAHLFVGALVWVAAVVLSFRSRRMLTARHPQHPEPSLADEARRHRGSPP